MNAHPQEQPGSGVNLDPGGAGSWSGWLVIVLVWAFFFSLGHPLASFDDLYFIGAALHLADGQGYANPYSPAIEIFGGRQVLLLHAVPQLCLNGMAASMGGEPDGAGLFSVRSGSCGQRRILEAAAKEASRYGVGAGH